MRKNIILIGILFVLAGSMNLAMASAENNKYRMIDKFLGVEPPIEKQDIMYQISTIDAVEKGYYDNFENKNSVSKKYGNFGVGLIKDNTGVVIYDGKTSYIVKNFQAITTVENEYTPISFGLFKYFNTDDKITLKEIKDVLCLKKALDEKLETVNHFVAFKAVGSFNKLIIEDVAGETQELSDVKGELIGFRMPEFMEKSVPTGYTYYFIADAKTVAGKVKNLDISIISFSVDYTNQLKLILPKNRSFKVKDFAQYEPKQKRVVEEKKESQKDLQKIMNTGTNEPTPDQMMQMMTPKMQF